MCQLVEDQAPAVRAAVATGATQLASHIQTVVQSGEASSRRYNEVEELMWKTLLDDHAYVSSVTAQQLFPVIVRCDVGLWLRMRHDVHVFRR